FDNEGNLARWKAALAAQRTNPERPLRISWFGDSLTADDHITHALRTKLAALVGDGGPGFVFAAAPHPYCQHRAVSRVVTGEWRVHGVSSSPAPDRLLGLGGSAETMAGSVRMTVVKRAVQSVDVHYLQQPRGGTLGIVADGKLLHELATAAERKRAAFARVEVPAGTKKIDLRAAGRVRLFGASLEAPKGAIVDNLGIVNATAKQLSKNNMPEHWKNQLAHRKSDLVVIMLGTNEAEWLSPTGSGMAEHERLFDELLASVRAGNPNGACLVISPLDQLDWRDEKMPPRESVPAMVAAQQRAATKAGCAFWNTFAWMGGKGASRAWFEQGLVVKDFQHPTAAGAARIADALYAGLVR
ncbi:MAG TPA: GDSL-type esterase/lipase family protein, partial [Kofleriaceae bacterium]|nr:GDSL-type esterase/lipase family protein [Kofleriaceae bacterium]